MIYRTKLNKSKFILLICLFCFLFSLSGCETLRKKFTRKPNQEREVGEPVLMPEEYKPEFHKDVLYQNYLVYWRTWQDELIEALEVNLSHKKQVECITQAVINLEKLRTFLNSEKQGIMDPYLEELKKLENKIKQGSLIGANLEIVKNKIKINRRNILRNFMYSKVKDALK